MTAALGFFDLVGICTMFLVVWFGVVWLVQR